MACSITVQQPASAPQPHWVRLPPPDSAQAQPPSAVPPAETHPALACRSEPRPHTPGSGTATMATNDHVHIIEIMRPVCARMPRHMVIVQARSS